MKTQNKEFVICYSDKDEKTIIMDYNDNVTHIKQAEKTVKTSHTMNQV